MLFVKHQYVRMTVLRSWSFRILVACIFTGALQVGVFGGVHFQAKAANGTFRNPLGTYPDPFMQYYNGNYYSVYTQDNTLKMAISPSIATLLTVTPKQVWSDTDPSRNKEVWAPAFFQWQDHWYLYYTADDGNDNNHRIYVLQSDGNDPAGPYSFKGRIDPNNNSWAIDPWILNNNGSLYFLYSGDDGTTRNRLFINSMSDPLTLSSDRTELAANGTCGEVREAPSTLQRNGRVFLFYSVCDTGKPDYHLEMMAAQDNSNLLDANSWTNNGVQFQRADQNGVYGPGSNGFFKSPDGNEDWIIYHAKNTVNYTYEGRDTRAQKINWNSDGTPNLGTPLAAGATEDLPSGDPGPSPLGLNDTDTTPGANYFEFQGNWNSGGGCGVQCYYGNDHWSNETNAKAIIHFHGTQIALLSVSDVGNGIAGISIDGGSETNVDYYVGVRQGEQLHYVSPVLSSGDHTLTVRVTGDKNPASGSTYVSIDRAEIYS
ncbi:MAG: glycoside hydrolase family 43 protein [Ktedonobacteraceae bacterium]|nr:glycoside hydrolase family 43 protein [Ktedonobacteraceae bacterium]